MIDLVTVCQHGGVNLGSMSAKNLHKFGLSTSETGSEQLTIKLFISDSLNNFCRRLWLPFFAPFAPWLTNVSIGACPGSAAKFEKAFSFSRR